MEVGVARCVTVIKHPCSGKKKSVQLCFRCLCQHHTENHVTSNDNLEWPFSFR